MEGTEEAVGGRGKNRAEGANMARLRGQSRGWGLESKVRGNSGLKDIFE